MIILIIICVLLLTGLRVAQEYQRGVVFRLGRYIGIRGPGLYWLIPLGIESQSLIDIRVKTVPVEQQETITRDSVTIRVNAVLWYKIVDPAMSVIAVTDGPSAVYQLALTSLRNIIGQHDLDEVLQSRDRINELLRQSTVSAATTWGISIERLEMKDVELPEAMQQVMAMQAEAIREKRARIIKAEAEFEAAQKLTQASAMMMGNPAALELRRMQMIAEVGAENNSTTVIMVPSDFVTMARSLADYIKEQPPGGPGPKSVS
jgi:regulator of protease activity HflC (stomatin/prohibitin superfamily)